MPAYKDAKRNTWYVKFRYKDWAGQVRNVTKRGFATKCAALQWERDFMGQKSGSLDMTFRDFVSVYLRDRQPRIRESTSVTKENIIETKLLPYFGPRLVRDITPGDVIQWQNRLLDHRDPTTKRPYSKVYLKTIHNQLSAIFNHAVRFYGLPENPARRAGSMGSEKGGEMKFWTREEYERFSRELADDPSACCAFELLYWTGVREGELLALTPADVNLRSGAVSISKTLQRINGRDVITEPKTAKSRRRILIPDFLRDELRDYIAARGDLGPDDRLFPVSKSFLHRKMRDGSQAAGIQRIRIHDLRHSHVSLLIHIGYSAVAIAERMGHESVDVTYRYAHLFPSVQTQMAEELGKLRKEGQNGKERAA